MRKSIDVLAPVSDGQDRVLDRLAAALGGSADAIFGAAARPSDILETQEALSLWLSLRNGEARARVLAGLRTEVAAQSE